MVDIPEPLEGNSWDKVRMLLPWLEALSATYSLLVLDEAARVERIYSHTESTVLGTWMARKEAAQLLSDQIDQRMAADTRLPQTLRERRDTIIATLIAQGEERLLYPQRAETLCAIAEDTGLKERSYLALCEECSGRFADIVMAENDPVENMPLHAQDIRGRAAQQLMKEPQSASQFLASPIGPALRFHRVILDRFLDDIMLLSVDENNIACEIIRKMSREEAMQAAMRMFAEREAYAAKANAMDDVVGLLFRSEDAEIIRRTLDTIVRDPDQKGDPQLEALATQFVQIREEAEARRRGREPALRIGQILGLGSDSIPKFDALEEISRDITNRLREARQHVVAEMAKINKAGEDFRQAGITAQLITPEAAPPSGHHPGEMPSRYRPHRRNHPGGMHDRPQDRPPHGHPPRRRPPSI